MCLGSFLRSIYLVQSNFSDSSNNGVLTCAIEHLTHLDIEFLHALGPFVYLAKHHKYGTVVFKFAESIPQKLRLKNEAEFLHQHPSNSWPNLLDYTTYRSLNIVMNSYQEGDSLAEIIKQGRQTSVNFQQLEELVGQLHQHGFIHGDLKPSNIIVHPEKPPSLIDFGCCCKIGTPYSEVAPNFRT